MSAYISIITGLSLNTFAFWSYDTEVKASIKANSDAITVLNGSGEGSVSKQVADAVASIVADAPEAYDTLKEISDWISSHADDAAAMNSQISTNKTDIASLKALVGTIPEGATATDIVNYIKELVDAEKNRATGVESGLDTRLSAVETKVGEGFEPISESFIRGLFN